MKQATALDLPRLVALGRSFHAEGLDGSFNPDAFGETCLKLIESDEGVIFLTRKGMIGGFLYTNFFDPDRVTAFELFWWSEDRQGGALQKSFEEWSREIGAVEIIMSSINRLRGDAVGAWLQRRGFTPRETSYAKEL